MTPPERRRRPRRYPRSPWGLIDVSDLECAPIGLTTIDPPTAIEEFLIRPGNRGPWGGDATLILRSTRGGPPDRNLTAAATIDPPGPHHAVRLD